MLKSDSNKAAAIKYNPAEDPAPVIIASGYGSIADKIIDLAEKSGVPVYKDDSAASLMCMLDVGTPIPPDLYRIVAAIYIQILDISDRISKEKDKL